MEDYNDRLVFNWLIRISILMITIFTVNQCQRSNLARKQYKTVHHNNYPSKIVTLYPEKKDREQAVWMNNAYLVKTREDSMYVFDDGDRLVGRFRYIGLSREGRFYQLNLDSLILKDLSQ